jgi:hypothetical protein
VTVEQGDALVTRPPENEFTEVNMISAVDVSDSVVDQLKQHMPVCGIRSVTRGQFQVIRGERSGCFPGCCT